MWTWTRFYITGPLECAVIPYFLRLSEAQSLQSSVDLNVPRTPPKKRTSTCGAGEVGQRLTCCQSDKHGALWIVRIFLNIIQKQLSYSIIPFLEDVCFQKVPRIEASWCTVFLCDLMEDALRQKPVYRFNWISDLEKYISFLPVKLYYSMFCVLHYAGFFIGYLGRTGHFRAVSITQNEQRSPRGDNYPPICCFHMMTPIPCSSSRRHEIAIK